MQVHLLRDCNCVQCGPWPRRTRPRRATQALTTVSLPLASFLKAISSRSARFCGCLPLIYETHTPHGRGPRGRPGAVRSARGGRNPLPRCSLHTAHTATPRRARTGHALALRCSCVLIPAGNPWLPARRGVEAPASAACGAPAGAACRATSPVGCRPRFATPRRSSSWGWRRGRPAAP